ncbi:hypothetical protein ACFL2A_07530, partial [Thermodesulfobacteriota bacterium]
MNNKNKKLILVLAVALVIMNLFLYSSTAEHEFVNFDDNKYVYENPYITEVNAKNVKSIFSKTFVGNYQPISVMSYAVDRSISGLNPKGFHITNVMFHTLNSILVLILLYLITGNALVSFIIALIFSVHPLQVESVAWVSERKGLICAFFYFLSFISYIIYTRNDKKGLYPLSILLFILALLSKPMAISFPIILLAFDYYEDKLTRKRVVEKIPYFILTLTFSIIAVLSQAGENAISDSHLTHFFSNLLF